MKDIIADTGEHICMALPALHAFSGCDSTSAFVRKGNVAVLRFLQKNPEFVVWDNRTDPKPHPG
jgi:hypothetical protein